MGTPTVLREMAGTLHGLDTLPDGGRGHCPQEKGLDIEGPSAPSSSYRGNLTSTWLCVQERGGYKL